MTAAAEKPRVRVRAGSAPVPRVAAGAYQVAGNGRRNRNWQPAGYGPNAALLHSLGGLQRRTRDLVRNVGYAETAADVLVSNLIGTGIKPQFATSNPEFNAAQQALWLRWTDEADADGMFDFYGLQALATRGMIDAGEVFARFRVRLDRDGLAVPLQLQLIESEFCPVEKNEMSPRGAGEIRMGIELSPIGKRMAYWMYRAHPDDWSVVQIASPGIPVPVPASEILHLYQAKRPGQLRGEPWLTRALAKLRDLDEYDDAELLRKKTAALFAGFITKPPPEDDGGETLGESVADVDDTPIATLQPGTMQLLDPGEEVKFSEPADVGGNYEAFVRVQLRSVATSARILYEQLTGDYSAINDRTFRAAVNEFRRQCRMLQHGLIVFQFCRPIVERWRDLAITSGALTVPAGMADPDLRKVRWVPEAWQYLHPEQDINAQRSAVRAGFKSRAEVVAEMGYDVEEVDREIASDNERADELGFVLDSDPRKTSSAGLTQARPGGTEIPPTDVAEDVAEPEQRQPAQVPVSQTIIVQPPARVTTRSVKQRDGSIVTEAI